MRVQFQFAASLAFLILILSLQTVSQTYIPKRNVGVREINQIISYHIKGETDIQQGKKIIIEKGIILIGKLNDASYDKKRSSL